ncbi:MAG: flagellar basal body P-ring protein FlgI [Planctomycetota bacterium]|nr:MAG: flagellar basal body P-ring protein FlgI [Planctomycetota bacterium]
MTPSMFNKHSWSCLVYLLIVTLPMGCDPNIWGLGKEKATTRPSGTIDESSPILRQSLALKGTIGEVTYVQGLRGMHVRGAGLVRGLSGKGSRKCPSSIRNELIREIRKTYSANPDITPSMTAEQLIDSLDTAAVQVEGVIPFGLSKGQRFDIFVRSVGQEVQTIAGGYLMQCDLKIIKEVSPEEVIPGKIHARACGPVFINPFAPTEQKGSPIGHQAGTVIGGGVNLVDRRLNLVSIIESYATVRQIVETINRRFGGKKTIANAVSPNNIELEVPPEFVNREKRFLSLITHLPLTSSQMQLEARANALAGELTRYDSPHEHIGTALEGIGTSVLPMIQRLYTDPRREVNYYASRTGLRLGDDLAIDVIIRHAQDQRSPFRLQAINELADCGMPGRAGRALRELLKDPDAPIRVLAYKALRKVDRSSMLIIPVGKESRNFTLDIVLSEGPATIYAYRTQYRRIALIGGDRLVFQPPLLYSEVGKPVTLSAGAGDKLLTVIRKNDAGNIIVKPFKVPLSVTDLIRFMGADPIKRSNGSLKGLGIDYTIILDMLYRLCEKGAINADFRWEEPSVEELLGRPLEPTGRPESEL